MIKLSHSKKGDETLCGETIEDHQKRMRKELLEKLGFKENQLIDTNLGALDIFTVSEDKVTYGFLAKGNIQTESVDEFLKHFPEDQNDN